MSSQWLWLDANVNQVTYRIHIFSCSRITIDTNTQHKILSRTSQLYQNTKSPSLHNRNANHLQTFGFCSHISRRWASMRRTEGYPVTSQKNLRAFLEMLGSPACRELSCSMSVFVMSCWMACLMGGEWNLETASWGWCRDVGLTAEFDSPVGEFDRRVVVSTGFAALHFNGLVRNVLIYRQRTSQWIRRKQHFMKSQTQLFHNFHLLLPVSLSFHQD